MATDPFHTFLTKVEAQILTPIIALLTLAAFLLFLWGVINFIRSAGDAEKRKTGQQSMIWGFIGLTIMFGAYAIMAIIKATAATPF